MSTPQERLSMARDIVNFEARRDKTGHLAVYHLPANDGGGRYEVAGINERYDGPAVRKLVAMLEAGQYDEAEAYAEEYIAENTDPAEMLTNSPRLESYLRDIVFNRGQRGCVKTLQIALGFAGDDVDGRFGPKSKAAMATAEQDPDALLGKLRAARETYERKYVGVRENLWRGLVNRWNGALRIARHYPVGDVIVQLVARAPAIAPPAVALAVAAARGTSPGGRRQRRRPRRLPPRAGGRKH